MYTSIRRDWRQIAHLPVSATSSARPNVNFYYLKQGRCAPYRTAADIEPTSQESAAVNTLGFPLIPNLRPRVPVSLLILEFTVFRGAARRRAVVVAVVEASRFRALIFRGAVLRAF